MATDLPLFDAPPSGRRPSRKAAAGREIAPPPPSGESGPEARAPGPPPQLEFTPLAQTDLWRVEKFDLLVSEFDLLPPGADGQPPWAGQMVMFAETARRYARGWDLVRRLYGIAPIILPSGADAAECASLSAREVCARWTLTPEQLRQELDTVRGLWRGQKPEEAPAAASPPAIQASVAEPELPVAVDLLEQFGFQEKTFEVVWTDEKGQVQRRDRAGNLREREWFLGRVQASQAMLRDARVGELARSLLWSELRLRRYDDEIGHLPVNAPGHARLLEEQRAVAKEMRDLAGTLEKLFPEFGGSAAKVGFKGCIHDWIRGYLEARRSGDFELLDRCSTAAEVENDCRQSLQAPAPAYRLGQRVSIMEATAGLFDPNWKTQLSPRLLKKLDHLGRAALEAARVELNEPLTDLEKPGDEGEYPPLAGEPGGSETVKQ